MKEILLLYPRYEYPRKSPPLGLLYLSSYLEAQGFRCSVVDFNVTQYSKGVVVDLLTSRSWLLVGISFMTSQFAAASEIVSFVREVLNDVPIVVGGPHPSSVPLRTMIDMPDIDYLVKGEGEIVLSQLVTRLVEGNDVSSIRGLYYRFNDEILYEGDCELIPDLDVLPYPAWGHVDLRKYDVFNPGAKTLVPTFPLLSSRGCPNSCTFCDSQSVFKRRFRGRSAENIIDEVMFLHDRFGMVEFDFVDDLITVNKARVAKFCELLIRSNKGFRWMANARVNTVDREMLAIMKKSGCCRVDFGVESADPVVLKAMRKNISEGQIREAHLICRDLQISTGSFTMVGNIAETVESIKMTIDLLAEVADDVMVSIACPYPGTELYRNAMSKGYVNTEDWSRYVTSPTHIDGYWPVMRTENFTEAQILEMFYLMHSFFAKRKFVSRYGRFFYLNPGFYREWLFSPKAFHRRITMLCNVLSARFLRPSINR